MEHCNTQINCISQVDIKEEVIIPDYTSDSESTLSDSDKNSDFKPLEECTVCHKYQSMFIILKNHDCEGKDRCKYCQEILHWSNCFKNHKESHEIIIESAQSSDSTASDHEDNKEKCTICVKYEFMIPLLKSHICQGKKRKECHDCSEVIQWTGCYKKHKESHEKQETGTVTKISNSDDSTTSDDEEIHKLLPTTGEKNEKCQVCSKYKVMLVILKESHVCGFEKTAKHCERCDEIIQWYKCFENHQKAHPNEENKPKISFVHFGRKFDCGICLKLNSILTNLVKNHTCDEDKSCTVCQEVSYWLTCLKNHKESERKSNFNENDREKGAVPWKSTNCSVCSKVHGVISDLSDHFCESKRGKKCDICQEISFWFRNLKVHEKHHNLNPPFKDFLSCNTCGKRFTGEKMLNVHKSYCESSFLVCEYCDRQFMNILSLKKHRILNLCHSPGSVQYKSKVNEKTFSNSLSIKNHGNFQSNLKLFKCSELSSQFKSKFHSKDHKKIHC